MSDGERIKPSSVNEAIVLGRIYINRDPLNELRRLRASIGWAGNVGYCIALTKDDIQRINDCIAFNEGRETKGTQK